MLMPTEIEGDTYLTQIEAQARLGVKDRVVFLKKMEEAGISWVRFKFIDERKKFFKASDIERLANAREERRGKRTWDKGNSNHS